MDREYSQFNFFLNMTKRLLFNILVLYIFVNLIHHLPVDNHA